MSTTWWVGKEDLFEEQLKVLDLDFDQHLLIFGPPGSGKTNLLLLRANHLHIAEESEFYIVAYTALLATFIRTGAELYSFPLNKIITQMKLYETVLGDHGMSIQRITGESFEERTQRIRAGIAEMMKAGKGKGCFPTLFIDEAQDYDDFDLSVFFYLAKTVCLSADPRQGIYAKKGSTLDWLQKTCGDPIRLKYHFRTGKKILDVADRIMAGKFDHEPMLDTSQYKEDRLPSSVEVRSKLSIGDQVTQASERLAFQLKAYPNELLGVLVPRKEDLQLVWELLLKQPELEGKITNTQRGDFDPDIPIWVTTIHSAKGLEFRSVHMIAADTVSKFNDHARRLAFTGVTRAKTVLIIYHQNDLLPFFAAALATKSEKKIGIDRLFGKSK